MVVKTMKMRAKTAIKKGREVSNEASHGRREERDLLLTQGPTIGPTEVARESEQIFWRFFRLYHSLSMVGSGKPAGCSSL